MTDDAGEDEHHEGEGEAEPEVWSPTSPTPPSRQPPLRSTAPQSEYTTSQVGVGFLVLLIGVAIAVGLPLALV